MFCSKCGNKSPEGARFCHKCGTKTGQDNNPAPNIANPNIQHTVVPHNPGMAGFHAPQNPANVMPYPPAHVQPGQPPVYNHGSNVPVAQNPQVIGYPAPPVAPSIIDYTNHQPYAIAPVIPQEINEHKADPTDYMDYDFFPNQPKSAGTSEEIKDETADAQFVDYPLQPAAQKPDKPEPTPAPEPSPKTFTDYTIHPNPPVNSYQQQAAQPTMDYCQPPQPSPMPTIEQVNYNQFVPEQAVVEPVAPIYTTPDPISYVDLPVQEPLPQYTSPNNYQSQPLSGGFVPDFLQPTGQYTNNQVFSSPEAEITPSGGIFSDIMPAPVDTTPDADNYYLDETDLSDLLPPPDLLFMDSTSTSKFAHTDLDTHIDFGDYGSAQVMPRDDFAQMQRYGSQAEIVHVPKGNKGKLLIALGVIIVIALAAVFFIFVRGGISEDQLVGTWAPSGPGMGTWVHRLQFNQDGTGRRYHFDEQYFHVANEDHFYWEITGRNMIERTRWIEGVPFHDTVIIELSRRYGEPMLRYRVESEVNWVDFRRVRVDNEEVSGYGH